MQRRAGDPPPEERVEFNYTLGDFKSTNYDEPLIQSYARSENQRVGVFDVPLPSPTTVTRILVVKEHCEKAEALYEKRMLEACRRIQDTIPARQLSIEWHIQMEVAMLEHDAGRLNDESVEPYFSPVKAKILERCTRLAKAVDPDARLTFQLGWGDVAGKFQVAQPEDLSLVVDLANDIMEKITPLHPVGMFVQILAPTDRTDVQYFKPLENLKLDGAHLYLYVRFLGGPDTAVKRTALAPTVRMDTFEEGNTLADDYPEWAPPKELYDICDMLDHDISEAADS